MNFTAVEFPATVDLNAFKAYFNLAQVQLPKVHGKTLPGSSSNSDVELVKTLRRTVLDTLAAHWHEYPIFQKIPRQADRNYLISQLDVSLLPIGLLSAHIRDDYFWRRCYQQRWKTYNQSEQQGGTKTKSWLSIYMERHLQEHIELMPVNAYDDEAVQVELDICAAYINQLRINYLQPNSQQQSQNAAVAGDASQQPSSDHIPLDYILHNLPELQTLRLTYCTKTAGMNFFLGCNTMTQNDIYRLARGLSRCYELVTFCLHSTKLEPYQLKFIARSLDKGCQQLTHLSLIHCGLGDEGIRQFVESCYRESFVTLRSLDLTNNKISAEGAYILSRVLRRIPLERLVLRGNPIESEGAATIFFLLEHLPTIQLDVSGCSITPAIMKLFMKLLIQNRTLLNVDISNNKLGEDFGRHLYKIIGFNRTLQHMDLRNTDMTYTLRNLFKDVLKKNLPKIKDSAFQLLPCEEQPTAEKVEDETEAEDVRVPQ